MLNKGFYIKSLIATGDKVQDARVDFTKGCNLIFGKSETGKSHILNLIDFLLGKRIRKNESFIVKEGNGYTHFYLEIALYETDEIFTIQRKLNGNSVTIKPVGYTEFHSDVKGTTYSIQSNKNSKSESYSSFLLKLLGFEDPIKLKSALTTKRELSYALIRHMVVANEGRVVSDNPIFSPSNQNTEATVEKSLIYYLTTGKDDSSFEPIEPKDIQRATIKGKISFIEDVLSEKRKELENIGEVDYADFRDGAFLKRYREAFYSTEKELNVLLERIKNLESQKSSLLSKQLYLETFLSRLKLLREHYNLDLSRYDFISQGHQLIEMLGDTTVCPICKSIVETDNLETGFTEALLTEVEKLLGLISDADRMIQEKEQEIDDIKHQLNDIISNLDQTKEESKKKHFKIEDIKGILERYQSNIENTTLHNAITKEISILESTLLKLGDELKLVSSKPEQYTRESNIKESFCNSLMAKLKAWNIPESDSVCFDEKGFDFVLNGKPRILCGKGARGVTCTAILMTLVEECIKNDIPFTRTLIIDSPITAHFTGETHKPEETTQRSFFEYCNNHMFDYQLIIIDNKSPELEDRKKLNKINYIEFETTGRPGFYPMSK